MSTITYYLRLLFTFILSFFHTDTKTPKLKRKKNPSKQIALRITKNSLKSLKKDNIKLKKELQSNRKMFLAFKSKIFKEHINDFMNLEVLVDDLNVDFKTTRYFQREDSTAIYAMQKELKLLSNRTFNGRCTWKISEMSFKLHSVRPYSSGPQFTHPYGYQFCLFSHFNGLNEGVDTHFAVSFKILQSDHDNLLIWPLRASICITIFKLDNLAHREFRWFEPTFMKPENNNPSNEIYSNTDITLDEIQEYIHEDCMYIGCSVIPW